MATRLSKSGSSSSRSQRGEGQAQTGPKMSAPGKGGVSGTPAGKARRGGRCSPSPAPRAQPEPARAPEPARRSPSPGWGSGAQRQRRRDSGRNYINKTKDIKKKTINESSDAKSRKEVSSKSNKNKVSVKPTERVPSENIESKDTETNVQPKLLSSSLKESTVSKGAVAAEQKKTKDSLKQADNMLPESACNEGEGGSSAEQSNPTETRAPLELMAEFLRAEMGQDYHLAKKLCEMILIYEPENPEAKEFFSLIEEMLQMEKSQNLEKDEEDGEEDSSSESGGENEDPSEESSDDCKDV